MTMSHQTAEYFAGVDLALRADHVGVLIDSHGRAVGRPISFGHTVEDLEEMLKQVRARIPQEAKVVWAAEPTSSSWRTIASYLKQRGELFVLQSTSKIHDLRKVDNRHYKRDDICAKTIAEATRRDVERDMPLRQPPSPALEGQRTLARRIDTLTKRRGSDKSRLRSLLCDGYLPALAEAPNLWDTISMLKVLYDFADARDIASLSAKAFVRRATARKCGGPRTSRNALAILHEAARDAVILHGEAGIEWRAKAVAIRETIRTIWNTQESTEELQQELDRLVAEGTPTKTFDCGTTVPGVGADTLAHLCAHLGPAHQWPPVKAIKRYAGLVPVIKESGNQRNTPVMSKLGEPLIRKLVHQIGNIARIYDAEFAEYYHRQMVHNHKTHSGACIATGLRALNILRAILRKGRPYQPRHPETRRAITKEYSRELARNYSVSEEIRAERRKAKQNAKQSAKQNAKHSAKHPEASYVKGVPEAPQEPRSADEPALCGRDHSPATTSAQPHSSQPARQQTQAPPPADKRTPPRSMGADKPALLHGSRSVPPDDSPQVPRSTTQRQHHRAAAPAREKHQPSRPKDHHKALDGT